MLNRVLEGTAMLILVYLVLKNADGFSSVARSIGDTYVASIKGLQGR